ncbi:vacuolar protein sorting-associated protein 33B [Daktulosphaira vitifoliae]|uniref:vacuolar protein sorting-associated protein 33B n=1 Tax=Daktulosphaira vitifoliae TaxID=58002 RepID=UPI0021A9D58B|nr:vacuolar protein sorting-associated protein 33B [Daktulosphaira vitifoliae]
MSDLNIFNAFLQISHQKLVNILKSLPGPKDLVIEYSLFKPLEMFIDMKSLRLHGVDKVYKLQDSINPITDRQCVFFVSAKLISIKIICDLINSRLSTSSVAENILKVILVPKSLITVQKQFEEEGVFGFIEIFEFQWDFIHLGDSFLSLEMNDFYQQTFVEENQSNLLAVSKSLWVAFMVFGFPQTICLNGKYSTAIYKLLNRYFQDKGRPKNKSNSCFLMLDRDFDYASILLTPCTYASLLDQVIGICNGIIEIKKSDSTKSLKNLCNPDEIYTHVKYKQFGDVLNYWKSKSIELQEKLEKSKKLQLDEMKQYVAQELQNVILAKKNLAFHIDASEVISQAIGNTFIDYTTLEKNMLENKNRKENLNSIEDFMAFGKGSANNILRLICLFSLTQDGFTSNELISIRTKFLHQFGFKYFETFHLLEKLNLILIQDTSSVLQNNISKIISINKTKQVLQSMGQKLRLISNKENSMSTAFGGSYVSAIGRIIEIICKEDVPDEIIKLLSNFSFQIINFNTGIKTVYVMVVGGTTYAEQAAFHFLEKAMNIKIIILCTNIINGNSLINSCLQ